jgi:hypothetical protein
MRTSRWHARIPGLDSRDQHEVVFLMPIAKHVRAEGSDPICLLQIAPNTIRTTSSKSRHHTSDSIFFINASSLSWFLPVKWCPNPTRNT